MSPCRLSFDIGGTFTDLVLVDTETGRVTMGKVLTTSRDPSLGVAMGIQQVLAAAGVDPARVTVPLRGATTLVTNTLIERKGARTALITTRGFRDVLEIGREWRYDIYDLFLAMPEPLVPRYLRLEVRERIAADGAVLEPLDRQDLAAAAATLAAERVEAVAVCFLHAYKNPVHEQEAAAWLRRRLPGVAVVTSAETVAEIREYERTSTTVASAYVAPRVSHHFQVLRETVAKQGIPADIYLMHSAGGIVCPEAAAENPIKLLESGPAAGALGAAHYGRRIGIPHLLSFDMGGTTAKICIIDDGAPRVASGFETARVHRFKKGSGLPVRTPTVDLLEIGAGGGSIASVDSLGLLKVGPESAGADPGPACYGRGGTHPTVTDADLVLGYLDPEYFVGGRMSLDRGAAAVAIERAVAQPLGVDTVTAAAGIVRVVNENMTIATKIHLAENGRDPRRYALFAFGGAGPVHAREVAARLGLARVICPLGSGVLSAVGLHVAPLAVDFVQTDMYLLDELPWPRIQELYAALEQRGRAMLAAAGASPDEVQFHRSADMRYVGQGYEITVPLPTGALTPALAPAIAAAFCRRYAELFGADDNQEGPVEVINWRLLVNAPPPPSVLVEGDGRGGSPEAARKGERPIWLHRERAFVQVPVYDHDRLPIGVEFRGPAVVEQRESTALIGSGDRVRVDPYRNLIIEIGQP